METGTGGGPQILRDDLMVEKSAELWKNIVDFSKLINHATRRSEKTGGAHITATTDFVGVS